MRILLTTLLLGVSTASIGQARGGALQPSVIEVRRSLTRTEFKEAERLLSEMGYWTGPVDGSFDAATRWALVAFQKYEGRPVTGRLTIDELEAIRNTSSPKPRDGHYDHVEVDLDRQVLLIVGLDENQKVRVLPVSTGSGSMFMTDGQESLAYTPRGRFAVYDKSFGWENGQLGSVYYANYISGGVAIHGYLSVPDQAASHGCIRIPMFAARQVSKMLQLGTIVLVYDKASFVSAKEWVENPKLKEAAMLNAAAVDYINAAEKPWNRKRRLRVTRT